MSSLGGRVAEQLILDDISTGASNDLQQATNIARQMITKYGFSERLGPVVYGTSQEETFLGRDLGQGKGYSETTAAEIDSEMRDIIDEAYETCRRTLTEHIDQLHALAQALMEREKLNEKEFNAVMAGETLPQREDPDAKPAEAQPAVQPVEQAETAEAAEPERLRSLPNLLRQWMLPRRKPRPPKRRMKAKPTSKPRERGECCGGKF